MRISGWRSDVFSSDLALHRGHTSYRWPRGRPVEAESNAVPCLQATRNLRIGKLEGHRHRRPANRRHGLVAQRHRIGGDLFDLADGLVKRSRSRGLRGGGWRGSSDRPRFDTGQTCLGINQELARGDNLLTFGEPGRSEEHTSELQSLMRISYAVFCLKK